MIRFGINIANRSVGAIDPDVQAFFNRVTTAGGSLTSTEQAAINQLVLDLKTYSLWSKMKAIYPMVGASSAACAQNLKSSSFTGTFTSGWTFASTGVTGNGTSAYMNTGFAPTTNLTANNSSIGYYGGTTGTSTSCAIGSGVNGSSIEIYPAYPSNGFYGDLFDAGTQTTSNTNAAGFIFAYRNSSSTQKKHSIRGTITTKTENTSSNTNNQNIYIGARNFSSGIGDYSNLEVRFAFVGDGLTDTDANNYYTAVQAFQTSLSRQI